MTTFDKRKDDAEARYKHSQEIEFKANARRNKLLGLWAAEQMGISGEDSAAYAKEVVAVDFNPPGGQDVFGKVHKDLTDKGLDISEQRMRKKMDEFLELARKQISDE